MNNSYQVRETFLHTQKYYITNYQSFGFNNRESYQHLPIFQPASLVKSQKITKFAVDNVRKI